MSPQDQQNQSGPESNSPDAPESCEPRTGGPVRDKGGTTGANNLSPNAASRTGGATSGVSDGEDPAQKEAKTLTPDP